MPAETTAAPSGSNDLLVEFDELCALARDGLTEGDYDVTVAALTLAGLVADEYKARKWSEDRLSRIRNNPVPRRQSPLNELDEAAALRESA